MNIATGLVRSGICCMSLLARREALRLYLVSEALALSGRCSGFAPQLTPVFTYRGVNGSSDDLDVPITAVFQVGACHGVLPLELLALAVCSQSVNRDHVHLC